MAKKHSEQPSPEYMMVFDIVEGEIKLLKTGIETNYYMPNKSENGKEKGAFSFTRGSKKFKITVESEDI